jgi:hypothetical protein
VGGPSRNQVRPLAIAAVLPGKLDNIGCETLLVVTTVRDLALRRAMLPERRTGATLGDMQRAALIALRPMSYRLSIRFRKAASVAFVASPERYLRAVFQRPRGGTWSAKQVADILRRP